MGIIFYLGAIVAANLLVSYFGPWGLLISSTLLIPFDFVLRCRFHERWRGLALVFRLGVLVSLGAGLTYLCNQEAYLIALGSMCAFIAANIGAGLFYQATLERAYLVKVNGSDLVAILIDSVVFQLIAFGQFKWYIMLGQSTIKFIGGLFWYYVLFGKKKI